MITRNKNLAKLYTLGLAVAGLLTSACAFAGVTVSCGDNTDSNCTSAVTGGRWDQNFGNDAHNCLYLLSINPDRNTESPIGPEVIETNNPLTCLGGLETTNLVGMGDVTVRVFTGNDPETNAYAYSRTNLADVSAAQFIPGGCPVTDFDSTDPVKVRVGSFDNGDTPPDGARPIIEPLSLEFALTANAKGNATVSYYFVQGVNDCRELVWTLKVNGDVKDSGPISDFALGKYLVFDLEGLEGGETVVLELVNSPDDTCNTGTPNSTVGGLFISGTSVCGYCGDGYWDRETEECDGSDPTDPNADRCSNECTLIEETPTRTLGYWKNHPTVINNESGVLDSSLLPLTFCGETIEQNEVCEAVDFLRSKGGGIGNFKRQGMAALLNCEAFGCSQDIRDLIEAGNSACAGSGSFDFGAAGSTLDAFNNSNDDVSLPFQSPSALPKYCSTEDDNKVSKAKKAKKKAKKAKKKAKKAKKNK